jgi:hypothetical protein
MSSQHRYASHAFRPDPDEFAAASEHLERRGQTAGAYLRACIRWLARDPDAALAATADDWPAPRPAGRPPSPEHHSPARPARSGPAPADGS